MGDSGGRQMSEQIHAASRGDGERGTADENLSRDGNLRLRPTRWLRLKVVEEGEKVISVTLPWIICSGALGLTGWLIRCVPRAVEAINKEVPGGTRTVDALLRAVRQMPAGTRIEVQEESSHVLIECR